MKFKKTKLTALAMSVLMAASTITSVTWAADLFTDGAPAEVVVEAPEAGETTELPVEDVAETSLLGVDSPVDVAKPDKDKIECTQKGDAGDPAKDNETGFHKTEAGEWRLYYKYSYGADEPTAGRDTSVHSVSAKYISGTDATCQSPATAKLEATALIGEKDTYIITATVTYGEKVPHKLQIGKVAKRAADGSHVIPKCNPTLDDNDMATDEDKKYVYYEYTYNGCAYCEGAWYDDKDGFHEGFPALFNEMRSDDLETCHVTKKTVYVQHVYGDWKYAQISANTIRSQFEFDSNDNWTSPEGRKLSYTEVKAAVGNVIVSNNGTTVDVYDLTKPAIVRRWKECKNCSTQATAAGPWQYPYDASIKGNGQMYVIWPGSKQEEKVYYEFTSEAHANIKGFLYVGKDDNGVTTLKVMDAKAAQTDAPVKIWGDSDARVNKIPVDKFIGVVLNECKYGGYYYERHYTNTSGTTDVDEIRIDVAPQSHEYGSVFVDTANTNTQKDKLAKDANENIKVKRDEYGNVTEAYGKDCVTEAKYVLSHTCLGCGTKEVVGTYTSPKGDHTFGAWVLDNSKTVYQMISDTQHRVHYMDSRRCSTCGKTETRDCTSQADVIESHGTLKEKKIEDGTEVEATCGTNGSYKTGKGCLKCEYVIDETITTVKVPATDKHDFGTNAPYIKWVGEVQVGSDYGNKADGTHVVATVVRKCNVCGKEDSNGLAGVAPGEVDAVVVSGKVDMSKLVPGKKNPATGVTYSCSAGQVTIVVEWRRTVDGKLIDEPLTDTIIVPYYATPEEYQARTAHIPGSVKIENRVEPTTEKDGSYDEVIYCTVCGDEYSRKTVTVPKDIEVTIPTVTATAVNYNTVNVSWTPVEGATSYRLYYRSADLGITTWHRVRTLKGTSFTHSGLTTGARYRYTVRAEVNGKLGDYSRTGSVARPLPAAPEMKSVTAVSNGTKVTWSKVDGADGYIIFRKTTGAFTRVGSVSKGSKVTWTDKKPVSGATYKVRAYRTVNNVNYKGAFSAAK